MEPRAKNCFACGAEGHIQRNCFTNKNVANNNNNGYNGNNRNNNYNSGNGQGNYNKRQVNQNYQNYNNNHQNSNNYNNNNQNQRYGYRNFNNNNNNSNYNGNYNGNSRNNSNYNSNYQNNQSAAQQPIVQINYDYLVALDVGATSDEGPNPTVTRENREIIELSWVIIDAQSLIIVNKKQVYVKPVENPTLTEFCTKQTGVTNEILETGSVDLPSALSAFDESVSELTSQGKTFCLTTDGVVDIRYILLREAHRKNITVADHYYTFFDLKAEFNKLARYRAQRQQNRARNFESSRPGLKQMRNYFGIPHQTQDDVGLDNCLLMAKIAIGILKNRRSKEDRFFRHPIVINKEKYDPNEDHDRTPTIDPSLILGENMITPLKAQTHILAMKGLPWSATEQDILQFFQQDASTPTDATTNPAVEGEAEKQPSSEEGSNVSSQGVASKIKGGMEGIHIVGDETGRPSGVCYVVFETHEDAKEALKYNKRYIGSRYVEVFLAMPNVLDDVLDDKSHSGEQQQQQQEQGDEDVNVLSPTLAALPAGDDESSDLP